MMNEPTVYLIHFNRLFKGRIQHYLGFTTNLEERLKCHKSGHGSRLLKAVSEAGIKWKIGRLWKGEGVDYALERKLKRQNHLSRFCLICKRKKERDKMYKWARYANDNYECSTKGDSRFSALNARLKDGRTIEEAYQLDVKGYRLRGNNWVLGKGKPPLYSLSREESWLKYKMLWEKWAEENPKLIIELSIIAKDKTLTDRYAATEINQVRALSEILNEKFKEGDKK